MSYKKWVALIVVVGVIIGLRFSGLGDFLTLENIQQNISVIESFVQSNFILASILYILAYIAIVAFSIPGATVMTLLGGFLFGAILGTVFVNIGATTGAVLVFLFARYLFGKSLQQKYAKQFKKFNSELKSHGANYLLTLRFIPIFPFFLINLLAGLTSIPLRTFAWTTAVGIIPGSFVYAFAGKQLRTIMSVGDIFSGGMLLAFVLLGLFALIPVMYKRIHKKHKKSN